MDNILQLFVSEYGEYAKSLKFKVLLIIIAIIVFFVYYFEYNVMCAIVLIVFAVYIGNKWVGIETQKVSDFNKITLNKLQRIQDNINRSINAKLKQSDKMGVKLSREDIKNIYDKNRIDYLYIDANMIHFIDSVSPLYEYNLHEYFTFIKGVNNILKLRLEVEEYYEANGDFPINISEILEQCLILKSNTLNNLHAFIYSVPKQNRMYRYIDDIISRYNVLITRNIDIIYSFYKKNIETRGINTTTKFIYPDMTKAYEGTKNHSVTPTKANNKAHPRPDTVPFYI